MPKIHMDMTFNSGFYYFLECLSLSLCAIYYQCVHKGLRNLYNYYSVIVTNGWRTLKVLLQT